MRTLGFLGLMALTLYLAGMFHVPALMTAFVAEAILLILQFILTLYFALRIRAGFAAETDTAYDNAPYRLRLKLENRAGIPAGRIGIRLKVHFAQEKRARSYTLHLPCPAGTSEAAIQMTFACCGRADVAIRRIQCYDFLSFFVLPKRVRGEEMRIYVLPANLVTAEEEATVTDDKKDEEDAVRRRPGDSYDILQIRPYREGDMIRHLHRNLSARLGEPMIRVFRVTSEQETEVLLSITAKDRASVGRMHKVYRALGKLLSEGKVSVFWYDAVKRELREQQAGDTERQQDLFFLLYELDALCAEGNREAEEALLTEKEAEGVPLYVLSASGMAEEAEGAIRG